MIGWAVALALVCALTAFDRPSRPYALILAAGWLLGFLPAAYWPAISIASGMAMTACLNPKSTKAHWLIALCVPPMLLCDAVYFWLASRNVYFGPEYANTLSAFLTFQLVSCGYGGTRNGIRRLAYWIGRLDRRGVGRLASGGNGRQGSEG